VLIFGEIKLAQKGHCREMAQEGTGCLQPAFWPVGQVSGRGLKSSGMWFF
jgi:hypothetical protein